MENTIKINNKIARRLMRRMATPESWSEAIEKLLDIADKVEGVNIEEVE